MKQSLSGRLGQKAKSWEFVLLLILILEFIIFGAKNPKSLMPNVLLGSVNDIISICIISLFVAFVMIAGGIDIRVASIVGLTSIAVGITWQDFDVDIWAACVIAIIAAALCGALSGFFVAYYGVQPMMVTLGGSFPCSGIALLISKLSAMQSYRGISGFPGGFTQVVSFKLFGVIPNQVLIFAGLMVIAYLLPHRSKYDRKVFLIGINPKAAEYSGLNGRLIILSICVLPAISAAIADIVLTSCLGTAKNDIDMTLTLPIITVVILDGTLSTGGRGSVIGTVLAALVTGILRFDLPLCSKINTQYLDIPVGLLLLIVITGRALSANPKVIKLMAGRFSRLSRLKS